MKEKAIDWNQKVGSMSEEAFETKHQSQYLWNTLSTISLNIQKIWLIATQKKELWQTYHDVPMNETAP